MTKEPPVTPQECLRQVSNRLRTLASEMLGNLGGRSVMRQDAQALWELADWLDEHMSLYREAVELHVKMEDFCNAGDAIEWLDRKRALLAKVKGE